MSKGQLAVEVSSLTWLVVSFVGVLICWLWYDQFYLKRVMRALSASGKDGDGPVSATGPGLSWGKRMSMARGHHRVSQFLAALVLAHLVACVLIPMTEAQSLRSMPMGPSSLNLARNDDGSGRPDRAFEARFPGRIGVIVSEQGGYLLVRHLLGGITELFLLSRTNGVIWRYRHETMGVTPAFVRELPDGGCELVVQKYYWQGPGMRTLNFDASGEKVKEHTLDAIPPGVVFPWPPYSPTAALFSGHRDYAAAGGAYVARAETKFSLFRVIPEVRLTIIRVEPVGR
jgi:hypothetical protein